MRYLFVSIFLPSFCLCLSCGDEGGDTTSDGGAAGEEGDRGGSSSMSGGTAGRGGSSSTSGGTGGTTSGSICERGCRTVTGLDCPEDPPDCVSDCEEGFSVVGVLYADCVDEYTSALECAVGHPASDWECNAAGVAQLNAAFCNTELEAFTTCTAL